MAKHDRVKADDIIFEGVLIPNGTRSAKIARKGITSVEEMSDFLTAVFSDTLKGKITLPKSPKVAPISTKLLNNLEQEIRRGVPVKIRGRALQLSGQSKTHHPKSLRGEKSEGSPHV